MKIDERVFGRFEKDGKRYNLRREEGDTQRPRQYAEANGYTLIPQEQLVLDRARDRQKRDIAKARYNEEMGGFALPAEQGGMFVRTDARSRTLLVGAAMNATADPAYTVPNWKTEEGTFITLDAPTIGLLYAAIQAFLATCFAKEAGLSAAIDAAATVEEIQAISY